MWIIWKSGEKKQVNEKANKVNNDLKLNVDEQQYDIKHLK